MLKRASDYLVKEFKKHGLTVMRYDAITSKSVYIKIDDGVVGTIRVSDHVGKEHLRYKYNLLLGSNRYKTEDNGAERYYFPMRDIEMLVDKVLYDREILLEKHGLKNYHMYMGMNKNQGMLRRGFWRNARYV